MSASSSESAEVVEVPSRGWDARVRVFFSRDEVETFVLTTQRYLILVDSGTTPTVSAAIMALVKSDLAGRRLLVVNTHADYDHAWGHGAFADDGPYPAPIIATRLAKERLQGQESRDRLERMRQQDETLNEVQLIAPTLTFDGDFQIDGGDLTVQLLATPGHTPDHVSIWIPELRLILAGDAAEFPFPWIDTPADMPLLRESLRRLVALEPFMVLPCHGETTTPDLLTNNLAYFDELERRILNAPELPELPEDWATSDELPNLIGFPYEDALALVGASPDAVSDTYRRFHLLATRSMVNWLLMSDRETETESASPGNSEDGESEEDDKPPPATGSAESGGCAAGLIELLLLLAVGV
jgi:glyoxylase-like metal-dependent hydrolase (beta-lactamase superfamily II)